MELIILLALVIVPFVFFFFVSRAIESAHFKRISVEEETYRNYVVSDIPYPPSEVDASVTPRCVISEVVISSSRVKDFFAKWRHFFGGEIKSYQSLQERAVRESRLRLLREAETLGCDALCNLRYDATQLSTAAVSGVKGTIMVCMLASATAYKRTA